MTSRVSEIIEERRHADKNISGDKTKERYVFHFSWTAPRGKKYEGTFINRILTHGDKADRAVLLSQYLGGVPVESVDSRRYGLHAASAHIEISLDSEERPEWAENFGNVIDEDVIALLFKEVDSHESIFRRPRKNNEGSSGDGGVEEGDQES